MLGWRKVCFEVQWWGLMNGIFPTTRGQWSLSAGLLLLNHGEGNGTRTHSSKSGHLVTADPAADHSPETIFSFTFFRFFGPFSSLNGYYTKNTIISHLNLLICRPDSIREVLINLFFFFGDACAMMICLCFGFIQSYFLLSFICVWSLLRKCCSQKIMFLSDDLCVLLAAWCF